MKFSKNIVEKLIIKRISISVAESCTGGELSSFFIGFSGISKIFDMGLITYSNKSKNIILNIPLSKIKKYGAVSEEIAYLMAFNLHKISKSKICISTTGIAGPKGGSLNKPVGLVYIAIKYKNKILVKNKIFKGSRNDIRKKTVRHSLKLISELI
jgi:nicotinamide-nucleotide amidase